MNIIGNSFILKPEIFAMNVVSKWKAYPVDLIFLLIISRAYFEVNALNPEVASFTGIPKMKRTNLFAEYEIINLEIDQLTTETPSKYLEPVIYS